MGSAIPKSPIPSSVRIKGQPVPIRPQIITFIEKVLYKLLFFFGIFIDCIILFPLKKRVGCPLKIFTFLCFFSIFILPLKAPFLIVYFIKHGGKDSKLYHRAYKVYGRLNFRRESFD